LIPRPENLARHELIGLTVEVAKSTDIGLAGLSGKIVDETRNMLLVETERGQKSVPKANTSLTFSLPDGQKVRVSGYVLISQPENRINKKIQRTRWKL
jgi:ribonuclease P protein subunit POP4